MTTSAQPGPSYTPPATSSEHGANHRTAYSELCASYRALDDFRTKLLGFLPVISGAGGFLLLRGAFGGEGESVPKELLPPIGVFGAVVTLALYLLEIHLVCKCHALIAAGKRLEIALLGELPMGQFATRPPRPVRGFINEPFAARIIYPMVITGWVFVALAGRSTRAATLAALAAFALAFLLGRSLDPNVNPTIIAAGEGDPRGGGVGARSSALTP